MGRFLVVAAVAAAVVVACAATADVELWVWTGSPPDPVGDVQGIVAAAHGRHAANETARAVNDLVDQADVRGGKAGSRLLLEELPHLAERLTTELPLVLARVRAVDPTTPAGEACRQAVLRLIERDGWLFRQVPAAPARGKAATKAIERFVADYEANARGYEADVGKCLALASADERPAIADLMARL